MSDSERIADRYQPLERVGAGGMGVVYRARDTQGNGEVALKVIRDDLPELAQRFEREVELLGTLKHPAIVRYLDHGKTSSGRPFLVMEWVGGPTLRQVIDDRGLTPRESVDLARQMAEALELAHHRGVLHRDCKPSNIILRDGDVGRGVLIDFGLARRTDRADGLTRTGVALGTPGYMAPEQALGRKDLDGGVDAFALGCVLYECLTGVAPFVGAHRTAVLAKLVLSEPLPLSTYVAAPAPLVNLIESLLEKRPEDRPSSCAEVAAALAALSGLDASMRARGNSIAAAVAPTAAHSSDVIVVVAVSPDNEGEALQAANNERVVVLADGALVLFEDGSSEGAERAARWALETRRLNPGALVSIVSEGVAIEGAHGVPQAALDRATNAILGKSISDVFAAPSADGVEIDAAAAAKLPDPFETTAIGSRLFLKTTSSV